MNIELLDYTQNGERLVSLAARQCYSEGFVGELGCDIFTGADVDRIEKVLSMGHTSVLEHSSYTFAIEGISRVCTHQLVRFRHASYSQQSQRYCKLGEDIEYIIPPSIQNNPDALSEFICTMSEISQSYNRLIALGILPEDARFVAPNAATTKIVMTMNARELHHAFKLRCCTHAQWEIRDMFNEIKTIVKAIHPNLFSRVGAQCEIDGTCPEGLRSCGKNNKTRK